MGAAVGRKVVQYCVRTGEDVKDFAPRGWWNEIDVLELFTVRCPRIRATELRLRGAMIPMLMPSVGTQRRQTQHGKCYHHFKEEQNNLCELYRYLISNMKRRKYKLPSSIL